MPAEFSDADKTRLTASIGADRRAIMPAYRRLRASSPTNTCPARDTAGLGALPNGRPGTRSTCA
jgi:hypothetical protein